MKGLERLLYFIANALLFPVACLVPRVTAADTTTLSQLMKQVYDPVIEEQQNLEPMTWNDFENGDDELGGQGWFFETKMGGNQEGIGARGERGTLPEPGFQRWKQGIILWKNLYGAFELTGQVIEAAKSNLKAFAIARTEEIEGLTRDVMKDFNRQIYGSGSGVLCKVTARTDADTFTVDDGMYLRLNMLIEVWDAAAPGTKNSNAGGTPTITSLVANADGTMTVNVDLAEAVVLAAGDLVARAGNRDTTHTTEGVSHEMTGLQAVVDDGTVAATFENISRTSFPLWKGHVLDNAGVLRNLTLDLLQQLEDMIYIATNSRPDWVRMNLGQRRKFFDLVAPDRRYQSKTFDAGFEKLSYNGLELTVDVDCPKKQIFGLTKRTVKKYSMRPFGLMDFDGLVLRQVTNKDVWRGYVGCYGNLGSKRPNCNARLTDLQEPAQEQWIG